MLTNLRDAFVGQSRSPNIVPFHMLGIVSYCAIVTLSLRHLRYLTSKNVVTLKWGQRSLKVIESGIIRLMVYGFLLVFFSNTLSLKCTVFEIFDFKNAVTLKTGLGVRQGHWKCHHVIHVAHMTSY